MERKNRALVDSLSILTNMEKTKKSLLYIDMAYTYEMIKAKKHFEFLESRHSDGYFSSVWGVHPFADVVGAKGSEIAIHNYSPNQTIVEGKAESFPWPRFLFPLNFLFSQYKLAKYLVRLVKENNISLIGATDPFYGGLLGLYLKQKCKKPLAIFVFANQHAIYSEQKLLAMPRLIPFRFLEVWISRKVFRNCDLVIGGTNNYLEYARQYGAQDKPGLVSPFSKNMSRFHLRSIEEREPASEALQRLRIPQGKKYLLSVARLEKVKHTDDAIKAMKVVMEEDKSVIGIMAGEGQQRNELQQMVNDYGLAQRIFFTGNLDQKTLSEIIPACITLSPLTGMALVECGLGGSPAVAYDRDWQPDFVKSGVNGFIVPFRDATAMGKKALEILRNPVLHESLSRTMRQIALDYADKEKLFQREHEAFDKMFANFYAGHRYHAGQNRDKSREIHSAETTHSS